MINHIIFKKPNSCSLPLSVVCIAPAAAAGRGRRERRRAFCSRPQECPPPTRPLFQSDSRKDNIENRHRSSLQEEERDHNKSNLEGREKIRFLTSPQQLGKRSDEISALFPMPTLPSHVRFALLARVPSAVYFEAFCFQKTARI